MLAVAARQRWFRGKLGGWWWCMSHARWLLGHRRATQELRGVSDRELGQLLTALLDPKMVVLPRAASGANRLLGAYWRLARRAL